jgi:hypothetical protein
VDDGAMQWQPDEVVGGALAGEDESAAEHRVAERGRVAQSLGAVAGGLGANGRPPLRWEPHTLDDAVLALCGQRWRF